MPKSPAWDKYPCQTIFRFVFEAEDEKFSHDYFDKQSVEAFSRPHIHTATGKTVFELVNWKGTTSNNPTIQSACDNISYVRFWRRTICHTFQQIMSRMNGMFRPIATKYGNGPADECSQRTLSLSWWSNSIKGLYYSRIDSLYVSRSRVFSCHFTRAFLAYHRIQLDSYDNHKNVQISSFPALLLLRTQIILHTHHTHIGCEVKRREHQTQQRRWENQTKHTKNDVNTSRLHATLCDKSPANYVILRSQWRRCMDFLHVYAAEARKE